MAEAMGLGMMRDGNAQASARLMIGAFIASMAVVAGCSSTAPGRPAAVSPASTPARLPGQNVAAQLRPCGADPHKRLSAIVGKPVYLDHVGDIGQQPVLSDGAVLPKIWVASCNLKIPAYPTTALYMALELTPSSAAARLEFSAIRTRMGLEAPVVTKLGYGRAAVLDLDKHGDAIVLAQNGAVVFTVEVTATSKPAPAPMKRLRIAEAVARLVIADNSGNL